MMICIVWEFTVRAGREQEFERHYSARGTWAEFFRRDPGYRGTELVRDSEDSQRYLTLDRWGDFASYEQFRNKFAKEYDALDARMEELTISERKIGIFDEAGR